MKLLRLASSCLFVVLGLSACGSPPDVVLDLPTHLIAATGDGVQIKGIGEKEWTKIEKTSGKEWSGMVQLSSGVILATARTPATSSTQTQNEGLLRSTDLGKTWTRPEETADKAVGDIIEFADSSVLASLDGEIWRSDDDGKTWKRTLPTPSWNMVKLADDSIIAGKTTSTGGSVISRSADGGKTWLRVYDEQNVTIGSPFDAGNGVVLLNITNRVPTTSYAFLKTTNYGKTWKPTSASVTARINPLARLLDGKILAESVSPMGSQRQMVLSSDSGDRWDNVGASDIQIRFSDVVVFPNNKLLGLGDTFTGLMSQTSPFVSVDNGATWLKKGDELSLCPIVANTTTSCTIELVPELVYGSVYAMKNIMTRSPSSTTSTTVGEVWVSADHGETWNNDSSMNADIQEILQVRIPMVK